MLESKRFKKVKSNLSGLTWVNVKNIKKNPKFLIQADKFNNLYELTTEEYNIRKMYKKTTVSAINAINTEAKAITKDLNLDERIEQNNQNQSFITLKDHEENFQNNPKCRLINPVKSKIGILHHIDQINKSIREN